MEKINLNDYVRTKNGEIHKVVEINEDPNDWNYYKYDNKMGDFEICIEKHSSNIIDLIEVGDYVNGMYVSATYLEGERHYIKLNGLEGTRVYEENFKNVVTHQQFNSIKYEVE